MVVVVVMLQCDGLRYYDSIQCYGDVGGIVLVVVVI